MLILPAKQPPNGAHASQFIDYSMAKILGLLKEVSKRFARLERKQGESARDHMRWTQNTRKADTEHFWACTGRNVPFRPVFILCETLLRVFTCGVALDSREV